MNSFIPLLVAILAAASCAHGYTLNGPNENAALPYPLPSSVYANAPVPAHPSAVFWRYPGTWTDTVSTVTLPGLSTHGGAVDLYGDAATSTCANSTCDLVLLDSFYQVRVSKITIGRSGFPTDIPTSFWVVNSGLVNQAATIMSGSSPARLMVRSADKDVLLLTGLIVNMDPGVAAYVSALTPTTGFSINGVVIVNSGNFIATATSSTLDLPLVVAAGNGTSVDITATGASPLTIGGVDGRDGSIINVNLDSTDPITTGSLQCSAGAQIFFNADAESFDWRTTAQALGCTITATGQNIEAAIGGTVGGMFVFDAQASTATIDLAMHAPNLAAGSVLTFTEGTTTGIVKVPATSGSARYAFASNLVVEAGTQVNIDERLSIFNGGALTIQASTAPTTLVTFMNDLQLNNNHGIFVKYQNKAQMSTAYFHLGANLEVSGFLSIDISAFGSTVAYGDELVIATYGGPGTVNGDFRQIKIIGWPLERTGNVSRIVYGASDIKFTFSFIQPVFPCADPENESEKCKRPAGAEPAPPEELILEPVRQSSVGSGAIIGIIIAVILLILIIIAVIIVAILMRRRNQLRKSLDQEDGGEMGDLDDGDRF